MQRIAPSVLIKKANLPDEVTIGPFCVLGENVKIGEGSVLGIGCVIGDGVSIGAGCKLGNYVTLEAGAIIGENVRIEDHTTVYGGVAIGENTYIGSNSTIGRLPRPAAASTVKIQPNLDRLRLGKGCTVGCSTVLYGGTSFGDQSFVGDGAVVRERCTIGQSVVIGSQVTVENDTSIGSYTKIQTGAYITAYMEIEERVFIAPMVTTTNDNFMGRTEKRFKYIKGATIGRGARVGGGSILLPEIKIAPETFIAAGALVTKDTPAAQVVKGFPARPSKKVPEEELLRRQESGVRKQELEDRSQNVGP